MKWAPCLLGLLLACAGCDSMKERLFQPEMKTVCEVIERRCLFENKGDPGEKCVEVHITHRQSGEEVRSRPVCSGVVDTNHEVVVPIEFPEGQDPLVLCTGKNFSLNFRKEYKVKIKELR